jgi:hypothetical protein
MKSRVNSPKEIFEPLEKVTAKATVVRVESTPPIRGVDSPIRENSASVSRKVTTSAAGGSTFNSSVAFTTTPIGFPSTNGFLVNNI